MRVVITGVGRGLGRALAMELAQMGHTVIGCSQSEQRVQALRKEMGAPHRFDVVDVTSADTVCTWAKAIEQDGGAPDILVCNAAVINDNQVLWKVPNDEFEKVISVNVLGVFYTLKAFLPAMVSRKQGTVVTLSSGWGRSTSPEVAPYCASKYAVEGMTLALASELPSGMVAVPLNPGVINTDMLQQCFAESASEYPSPQEWAKRAAPFILSLNKRHHGTSQSVPGM